jgi:hypothetical protein
MVIPPIATRVKERRHLAGVGIDPRQIASLVEIAFGTRQRKIIRIVGAPMFSRDDMLNVERDEGRRRLPAAAIFATIVCPGTDSRPRCGIHSL